MDSVRLRSLISFHHLFDSDLTMDDNINPIYHEWRRQFIDFGLERFSAAFEVCKMRYYDPGKTETVYANTASQLAGAGVGGTVGMVLNWVCPGIGAPIGKSVDKARSTF